MKQLIRVTVSAIILGFLAYRLDWPKLIEEFRDLDWRYCWLSIGVFLAMQIVSSLRWMIMARPLGFGEPLWTFVSYYFIGMFFNLLLPTSVGGDAVRAIYLNAGRGRRSAAILSVLLERLSGLLVLCLLACVAAWFCPVDLPLWMRLVVVATALGMLVGLASMPWISQFLARIPKLKNLAHTLQSIPGLYRREPALILNSVLLSIGVQFASIGMVALIGKALGNDVPISVYGVAVPMVSLLTLLPVSLNGMGIREAGMILFLGPAGVAREPAIATAFLWFLVHTVGGLIGALLYLFGGFSRPEVRHDDAISDRPSEG